MIIFLVVLSLASGYVEVGLTNEEQQYLEALTQEQDTKLRNLRHEKSKLQDQLKPRKSRRTQTSDRTQDDPSSDIPKPGSKHYREFVRSTKEKIEVLEKQLAEVEAGQWEPSPSFPYVFIDFTRGKLRSVGAVEVLQVLGKSEALIKGNARVVELTGHDLTFWLQGVSTANMADGQSAKLDGPFVVDGTRAYQTVAGGSKTVYVLRGAQIDRGKVLAEYRARCQASATDKHEKAAASKPKPSVQTEEPVPESAAQKRFSALLSNSRKLIKAGLIESAEKNLGRIVKEAPGTAIAAEAQKELDHLPAQQ